MDDYVNIPDLPYEDVQNYSTLIPDEKLIYPVREVVKYNLSKQIDSEQDISKKEQK